MNKLHLLLLLLALPLLAAGEPYVIQGLQCPEEVVELGSGPLLGFPPGKTYKLIEDSYYILSQTVAVVPNNTLCIIGTNKQVITTDRYDEYNFMRMFAVSRGARLGLANLTLKPAESQEAIVGSSFVSDDIISIAMRGVTFRGQVAIGGYAVLSGEDITFIGGRPTPLDDRGCNCLLVYYQARVTFWGQTKFQGCTCPTTNSGGSGLTVYSGGGVTFHGPAEFKHCKGGFAAAVYVVYGSFLEFKNHTAFINNTATNSAGAVRVADSSSIVFSETALFKHNSVTNVIPGVGCVMDIRTEYRQGSPTSVSAESIELVSGTLDFV